MRRVLGVTGVVGLVVACGVAAFLTARSGGDHTDPEGALPAPSDVDPRTTYAVDGRAYSCLTSGVVSIAAEVRGTTNATFVVDGAEVASELAVGTVGDWPYQEIPEVSALMPRAVTVIRCADSRVHRVEVYTDHPEGCRLMAQPDATFTEARNHSMFSSSARLPDGVCTLTLRS